MTQPDFAAKLDLSKSHLNDIEKGRKLKSPERAARFAKLLGYSQTRFVKLALQDLVDRNGLKLSVEVRAAQCAVAFWVMKKNYDFSKSKPSPYAQLRFLPDDVANHLRTPNGMAAYLNPCFKSVPDDTAGVVRALGPRQ